MPTTLTAKVDLEFSFGEIEKSWTFAKAGESLELVEDYGSTVMVRNVSGDEITTDRDKLLFS